MVEGEIYNMWNTRAYPGATMWLNEEYAEQIKKIDTYQNRATNVRFIGGSYKMVGGEMVRDYTMEAFIGYRSGWLDNFFSFFMCLVTIKTRI